MFVKLEELSGILKGKCVYYETEKEEPIKLTCKEAVKKYGSWCVVSLRAQKSHLAVLLAPYSPPETEDSSDEEWYREHIKQFGKAPTFF